MSGNKRFDNWTTVDCNECANYWTNSCDGVQKDDRKPCNSFLAQRNVTIPLEIESLRDTLKCVSWQVVILQIIMALHLIGHILNLY